MLPLLAAVADAFSVLAGMPTFQLTDIARLRLQSISFFLVVLLLSAAIVRWIWNRTRRDFPKLPEIRYLTSLAVTVLWGLLFLVVLTMISGARELLTPGAWRKTGLTYELREDDKQKSLSQTPETPSSSDLGRQRLDQLDLIRLNLWTYAARHDGQFPPTWDESGLPKELVRQPGIVEVNYGLYADRHVKGPPQPLVFEYQVYGDVPHYVLMTSGLIRQQPTTMPANNTSNVEGEPDSLP